MLGGADNPNGELLSYIIGADMMPQRTFLMMLIVICVTILCFVWMVRDSLCGLRLQQGNTVLVATLAYEVKR